jgi:uncharacterized protein YcbK (DUF882 family)
MADQTLYWPKKAYYQGMASDFDMPWWPVRYPNFRPGEVAADDGSILILAEALDALQAIRTEFGMPFILNSSYRTAAQNRAAGSKETSMHRRGHAFDIGLHNGLQPGHPRFAAYDGRELEHLARKHGFNGIGRYVSDYDSGRRGFIHIDMRNRSASWGSW